MSTLSELCNQYGSDKDRNGYCQAYDMLFSPLREQPVRLLEIGIGTMIPGAPSSMVGYSLPGYAPGGSLRAWRDFFAQGEIHGADIQDDTQFTGEERITTHKCNSTDRRQVDILVPKLGGQFDIIIDDGSHHPNDQIMTLRNFFPLLKPGGYYIIEDIGEGSPLTVAPVMLEAFVASASFMFVGVKNNICVIKNVHLNSSRQGY